MDKKQRTKLKKYNAITMQTFLKDYAGITSQLNVLKNAIHKDIKRLNFDNIKALPFEMVDNDDLATGDVLLVIDINNNIAPYKNPLRIEENKIKIKKRGI